MGIEGYDYPGEDRFAECDRCGGTGWIYFIARSKGNGGDYDEATEREVSKYDYDKCPEADDAPAGEWCKACEDYCPDCDGEGWIDMEERRWEARQPDPDAWREEMLLRRTI